MKLNYADMCMIIYTSDTTGIYIFFQEVLSLFCFTHVCVPKIVWYKVNETFIVIAKSPKS